MRDSYVIRKGYQDDERARKSFNRLAGQVFGLDFEKWYQNGFWKSNYIPYSILEGDEVLANVSVSPMLFLENGEPKHYIQLGTVMTCKSCRKQGLIRQLIQEIQKDYDGKTDGWFLFANESVLDFYPKFGFRRSDEFEYGKDVIIDADATAVKVQIEEKDNLLRLRQSMRESCPQSSLWLENHEELTMFYALDYMRKKIYFLPEYDAYVFAGFEKGQLYLHQIFAPEQVDVNRIAAAFGREVKTLVLGFTPIDKQGFTCRKTGRNDTVLYIKGSALNRIERDCLRIPELAHT
ncbi:acetyltransferase [Lacrimispora amygdalina]|uniref:Acetyltransferase n=1 Tax=Lacrimispora amygdalina TaxID=253257 RepID=A0A3E2NCA3_9FIRM|nr:GNAT family N-acetyltransferase [Clostridium indicum]RFZ78603.1 GNAT family N-acetyltransferase [Clostridium indicum]